MAGGIVKPYIGFQVSHVWVKDYTGDTVKARNAAGEEVDATQLSTHLNNDCTAGTIDGCNGGWDNFLKLGIVVDTRDFEPDPSKGFIYELLGEFSTVAFGSSFNYGRMTNTIRAYGPLFKHGRQRLVAAGRFLFNWQFGDVPFFSLNEFASSENDFDGLGGFKTLRGFTQDRFVAPVSLLFNAELRYTFAQAHFLRQTLGFTLAPFLDLGKGFDSIGSGTVQNWELSGGAGLRLSWNVSTVVSFDYGIASEGQGFYMTLGHSF
jgi:outer membrane protein assembly factor BamA